MNKQNQLPLLYEQFLAHFNSLCLEYDEDKVLSRQHSLMLLYEAYMMSYCNESEKETAE